METDNLAPTHDQLFNALILRDKTYDGFAWVCVKTTKIYCKLSCSARKPLRDNVEFVFSCEEARQKGYRECKLCRPNQIQTLQNLTKQLLEVIDENPGKYWRNSDLKKLGIDESSARRSFRKDLGISFIEYTRQKRLALAISRMNEGGRSIDAQLDAGFESASGFQEAIKKSFGANLSEIKAKEFLSAAWFETPIGPMLCIVNGDGLHLLEFAERKGLAKELQLTLDKIAPIVFQNHDYHDTVKTQLSEYFEGLRKEFDLKIAQWGTQFEKAAWQQLSQIPYATTKSYSQQAQSIGNEKAVRAVARANGKNKIAIIIPCHRVIGADGDLTGYGGQIWRKQWLLNHEKKYGTPFTD